VAFTFLPPPNRNRARHLLRRWPYVSWRSLLACWALVMLTACQGRPPTTQVSNSPPLTVPPVLRVLQRRCLPRSSPFRRDARSDTRRYATAIPVELDKCKPTKTPPAVHLPLSAGLGRARYTQPSRAPSGAVGRHIVLHGPQGNAGPVFVVMYKWPALDPTQPPANATAWSSVAACPSCFSIRTA